MGAALGSVLLGMRLNSVLFGLAWLFLIVGLFRRKRRNAYGYARLTGAACGV